MKNENTMYTSFNYEGYEGLKIELPERSKEWECWLYGTTDMKYTPLKDNIPNLFWRIMQYLILGNRWGKNEK